MKLEWKLGENTYQQDLDMKQFNSYEEISQDISGEQDLWLGLNLLDVEAFRQYKKANSSMSDYNKEYYTLVLQQYEKIDSIIEESFIDAVLANNMYKEESTDFERAFADLVLQLSSYLHSRIPIPLDFPVHSLVVPSSGNEHVNYLINEILSTLSTDYYNEDLYFRRRRNPFTIQKDIIRRNIIQIAMVYSEESRARYHVLYAICRNNDIRDIYSYDLAMIAVYTHTIQNYITHIEDTISTRIHFVFENRLDIEDFHVGLSTSKIKAINQYYKARLSMDKKNPYYGAMCGRLRDYFKNERRCLAIMEFPDKDSDNMFALSGTELKADQSYDVYFKLRIANTIAQELSLIDNYIFCEQTNLVRRYAHKISTDNYIKLPQWNYLYDDPCWEKNQGDYACCERKFIAKLEKDNKSGAPYPIKIDLWTRLHICDNCDYAIRDYEHSYGAVIYRAN